MTYDFFRQCATFLLDLLVIRALSRILDMRSTRIYVISSMVCVAFSIVLAEIHAPDAVRILYGMATFGWGLPIGMSRGLLRNRIARTTLVNGGTMACEFVGTTVYQLMTGQPIPEFGEFSTEASAAQILVIYTVIFLFSAFLFEVMIAAFNYSDGNRDTAFQMPLLIALLWSCLLITILEYWLRAVATYSLATSTATFLCSAFAILLGLLSIMLARNDARTRRKITNSIVSVRQIKHVRSEVEASARRSSDMRKLRHDIANQIDVVMELANSGKTEEADKYLETLQKLAHKVSGRSEGPERTE